MLQNFFKIAFRNLSRKKLHSFINLFGLTVGLAASIMIVSYIFYEISYDKHHENSDKIYRIYSTIHSPDGSTIEAPITAYEFPEEAAIKTPEIECVMRLARNGVQIKYNSFTFTDIRTGWVDSTYFKVFTHKFLQGNKSDALRDKHSLVITESTAKKLFGNNDGYGKMVRVDNKLFKITAIVEDFPVNSHFEYDALAPIYNRFDNENPPDEGGFSYIAYLLSTGNENPTELEVKVNNVFQELFGKELEEYGSRVDVTLQTLSSIHLHSKSPYELKPAGDINNIYIFSVLAFFIMIIAVINFINLTTASSETRAREIGLRKVMGAYRQNLFKQFISESMMITFIAFILALGITELFIDSFRELMNSPILLLYKTDFVFILGLLLSVIIIGFIAGSYPALQLAKYLPVEVLKGSKSSSGKRNVTLQRVLVVFQFTIATFLLISLNLVYKQIHYMKNKDLGFDKVQILVMGNLSDEIRTSYTSLKAELLQLPEIKNIAGSQTIPGISRDMSICYKEGDAPTNNIMINRNQIQYDFLDTYGIKLKEGRDFNPLMQTDSSKVILNEAAVKALGLENPLNQKLITSEVPFEIIGIVKDYHFKSLHEKIAPLMLLLNNGSISRISIKLNTQNLDQSIKNIENTVRRFDPNYTFNYTFLDQTFAEMYQAEERINKLVSYASILAIIISILGLIALTMQTIQKRIHEIGVRKVMGAEIKQVVKMFALELSKWVVLACIIAIPLAYNFSKRWLENFVYQTEITFGIFIIGCLISLVIAVLTVGIISYRAAKANPVDSLKYE